MMLFLLGWLGLRGKHVGFFDMEFGAVVFAALNVVVFTIALILCIRTLKQFDARRAEKASRHGSLRARPQLKR
jgi:hypothetical protein